MKKCAECGRELREEKGGYFAHEDGKYVGIIEIPVYRCDCGEDYFSAEVMNRMNNMLDETLTNSMDFVTIRHYETGERV